MRSRALEAFLENAAGAVIRADILQERIDGHRALAALTGLLAAAARRAQHDGGAGSGGAARGALASASAGGKRHLLAEVAGHGITSFRFLLGGQSSRQRDGLSVNKPPVPWSCNNCEYKKTRGNQPILES
jgi:hypothetical protein